MSVMAQMTELKPPPLAFLIVQDTPLPVGSITVEPNGGIRRSPSLLPFNFAFTFDGHAFTGIASSSSSGGARLDIATILGTVPYSAESVADRDRMAQLITGFSGSPLQVECTRTQELRVSIVAEIEMAPSPLAVVSTVVERLLDIRSYLSLASEIANGSQPAS